MATDSAGSIVSTTEGQFPTYSVGVAAYAGYTSQQDMIVLNNPATSTIICKVSKIRVSGTATSATMFYPYVYVRSALNTGGTSTSVTNSPADLNDPASTGAIFKYSAAPSNNGTAYLLRADAIILANATTPVNGQEIDWLFGDLPNSRQVHVRPGQCLAINANGLLPGGMSLYATIQWAETPVSAGF